MIKASDQISVGDIEERKKDSLQNLLKNKVISEFVNIHHIDYSLMSDYWVELLDFEEDHNQCKVCTSYNSCPKITKGMQKELIYDDGRIVNHLKYCRFGKEKEKEDLLLNHFVFNNAASSLALTNLNHTDFLNNPTSLPKNDQNAIAHVLQYIRNPSIRGLYVYGDSGTGKTVLMAGLLNALAYQRKDVGICHFPTFLIELKASFNNYNSESLLQTLMDVPYLLLDGVGEENVTAFSRDEILLTILSYRQLNSLPTFMTSSFSMEELKDVYTIKRSDKTDKLRAKTLVSKMKALCNEIMLDEIKIK